MVQSIQKQKACPSKSNIYNHCTRQNNPLNMTANYLANLANASRAAGQLGRSGVRQPAEQQVECQGWLTMCSIKKTKLAPENKGRKSRKISLILLALILGTALLVSFRVYLGMPRNISTTELCGNWDRSYRNEHEYSTNYVLLQCPATQYHKPKLRCKNP